MTRKRRHDDPVPGPWIRVTPAALEMVRAARSSEDEPDRLALWLEVNGSVNGAYTYDLWFGSKSAVAPGDVQHLEGDLPIVISARSAARVRGAVLDASAQEGEPGLVIINANTPPPTSSAASSGAQLSGPIAQRVIDVLERDVNPQIAMHGGRAALVGVEGPTAYVEMSGGCQGCGLARTTLSQGVAVVITDAVSEIDEVVDVTDHLSGTDPFYERARGLTADGRRTTGARDAMRPGQRARGTGGADRN